MGSLNGAVDRLRIGVAILHGGDARALDISLQALNRLPIRPRSVVVAEDPHGLSPLGALSRADVDAWLPFRPGRSPCSAAVSALSGCDLAAIITEGTVLGPAALTGEVDRFAQAPVLRASLILAALRLDIDAGPQRSFDDPFALLRAEGRRTSEHAPLYFSPCMLTVAPSRGGGAIFDRFARHSEWAVAQLFMNQEVDALRCFRGRSAEVGFIGPELDRRSPRLQGREAYRAISRLSGGYETCADLARQDVRRLVREQIEGVIRFSSPAARVRFLAGVKDARREEWALKRSIARDIAELS